ncbi:MAG: T9SS type A sorting domain-containing protein [Ignavibacteria bacterium]|nr:T9SS type A sorting domain-containing protein [Ignavibacteria bacterium]
MKTIIVILVTFLLIRNIFSYDTNTPEIYLVNYSSNTYAKFQFYPISAVFNGNLNYDLRAANPEEGPWYYHYIAGVNTQYLEFTIGTNSAAYGLGHDGIPPSSGYLATLGYGKYKVIVSWGSSPVVSDTCTIEFDYLYGLAEGFVGDVTIGFRDDSSDPRIVFQWSGGDERNLRDVGRKIESWNQYEIGVREKSYGDFVYDESHDNDFTVFPQDSRRDPESDEMSSFTDNRSGILTQNLTINKNVYTPDNVWPLELYDFPTIVSVSPGAFLKLDTGKILDFTEVISSDPNAHFEMNVEDNGRLILYAGSKILIRNKNHLILKHDSRLYLGNNSEIRIKPGGLFCNEGALIRGNGRIVYEGSLIHHIMCASLADYVVSDSAKIILDSNAVLEIPDSSTISFYGNRTGLVMHPNSVIKFGVNSKLLFDSSATLIAKGATFTSLDTSKSWEGVVLQNSGEDSVINCTFSNAKTSLALINTPGHTFYSRIIKGNIFNVPSVGVENNGIYGENNFRITIQDNVFNMPANPSNRIFGVYLKNNNTTGVESLPDENEGPAIPFSMFLINNIFNNGTASTLLLNYTSSYLPFYVRGNTFNSAGSVGIIGRNITGSIKDNVFSNSGSIIPIGIHLITSSPDFYNNAINSENVSLHTIGSSFPNLAPSVSGSSLSWHGGKNLLSSLQSDNIQLVNAANVYTNLGENRFTVSDTAENRYHIYGWVDTTEQMYFGRNNCWLPNSNPRINLRRIYTAEPIPAETGLTDIDCDREISANDLITEYLGIGVYDTIKQSPDTTGSELTEEELLYNQGQNYISAGMLIEGISALKNLIDDYIYFEDLPASVYDLYSCYEYLDTTEEQSYRNTLYGNLKLYLDNRINSEEGYDGEFISNAYNITLMCDANMLNYDDAANGYEFISLFHPDPDIRLNASWDYAEIEALMGGGYGGGEKDLGIGISDLELTKLKEINEMNRINEIINNDPVMMKVKEVYDKTIKESSERNERSGKQINDNFNNEENYVISEQSIIERESDKFKNEKARRNIFELKNLNRQELEKRRVEDMLLSAQDARSAEFDNYETASIPSDFKLNQNYPNPFNPVTNVEFGISKSGFVTLKVYNVLGKEAATLVNEILSPGKYTVIFNGSSLASGVYFYTMKVNNLSKTKKMVIIR